MYILYPGIHLRDKQFIKGAGHARYVNIQEVKKRFGKRIEIIGQIKYKVFDQVNSTMPQIVQLCGNTGKIQVRIVFNPV
jgi:hypothetical protein